MPSMDEIFTARKQKAPSTFDSLMGAATDPQFYGDMGSRIYEALSSGVRDVLPTGKDDPAYQDKMMNLGMFGLSSIGKIKGALPNVFRAVSAEDLAGIQKSGQIKSNSTLSLPIEKHLGLTPYGSTMEDVLMYAKLNSQGGAKSHILEVKQTPDMRSDYVQLPKVFARRNELLHETEQLQNTLARPILENKEMFAKWLKDNQDEIVTLNEKLRSSGIPEDKLLNAPNAVNLPYLMTPQAVSAANIVKVHDYPKSSK